MITEASAAVSAIHSFSVERSGAGMKVSSNSLFLKGSAVTDVEYGYDGKAYISDFIGGWSTHNNGRIYSIANKNAKPPKGTQALLKQGIKSMSPEKLTELLNNKDMRIRLRAQFALVDKQDPKLFAEVLASNKELIPRLHAIWGLGMLSRSDRPSAEAATALLVDYASQSSDAEIQAQIARCLGEAKATEKTTGKVNSTLLTLLKHESARVQAFAAISLGRRKHQPAFETIISLLEKNNTKDLHLRHAYTMGILGTASADQIAALNDYPSEAVRLAAVVALRKMKSPRIADFLAKPGIVQEEAIRAINDLPIASVQQKVADILPQFSNQKSKLETYSPMMQRRLIHSAFRGRRR